MKAGRYHRIKNETFALKQINRFSAYDKDRANLLDYKKFIPDGRGEVLELS